MIFTGAITALAFGSTAPLSAAVGDSRTANRNDGQTCWPFQSTADGFNNLAVVGTLWAQIANQAPASAGRVVAQGGVNNILSGDNGTTLFATERAWAEARAAAGAYVFLLNMPGFKGYDNDPAKWAQRDAFNSAFAYYSTAPAARVVCVDIASPMWDPADPNAMLGAYTTDSLHYTTAGNAVIAARVDAAFTAAGLVATP